MNLFKDVLLYSHGKDPGERKKDRVHTAYIYIMLILMGIGISVVSLFLASPYPGQTGNAMFLSYFRLPLLLLLNTLPCILLILLVYFISGRAWISFLGTSLLILGMSAGNYYKIRIRSDPFIASDLGILGEAGNIASNYTIELTARIAVALLCFAFGLLFAIFFMKGSCRNWKTRAIGGVAVILAGTLLFSTLYKSDAVYKKTANTGEINIWNETEVFVSKGFLYPFIYSIKDAFPDPPAGYDKAAAQDILAAYEGSDIPQDKKVNIISIMFEAYADLSSWEGLDFQRDVYAGLHELEAESVSGTLISNVFGGGTVDTERAFLTGYTRDEDYRKAVNSYVWYLREQGYHAEGLHTGDGWFYNRLNVNNYLGFEDYFFLEDDPEASRSDEYFFSKLNEQYRSRDKSVPYFNYSLTYQNHGAYPTDATCKEAYISPEGLSTESYNILNNYLSGICDTSNRMLDFVDGFRDDEEPVVIVMFGDHKPWLGDNSSVYKELGISLDLGTEEGFYNYFSTPYLIWANDAAKDILGNDFQGEGQTMSACFLMNEVFRLCSWEGGDFMRMNDELREISPIVNDPTGYFLRDGALTQELPAEEAEFWTGYKWVQYYLEHEFLY